MQLVGSLVAVIGAGLCFGSFVVPFKIPRLRSLDLDPAVMHIYISLVVFATSWLVLIYNPFDFTVWGLVGAGIFVIMLLSSLLAVKIIGMAVAMCYGGGLTVITSYLWRILYFHDHLVNPFYSVIGLCMVAGAIIIIAVVHSPKEYERSCRTNIPDLTKTKEGERSAHSSNIAMYRHHNLFIHSYESLARYYHADSSSSSSSEYSDGPEEPDGDIESAAADTLYLADNAEAINSGVSTVDTSPASPAPPPPTPRESEISRRQRLRRQRVAERVRQRAAALWAQRRKHLVGVAMATTGALAAGSLGVPLALSPFGGAGSGGVAYLLSFGIGVLIITPPVLSCYFAFYRQAPPAMHWRVTAVPGVLSGLLYSSGYFASIYAGKFTGTMIGFPLLQLDFVVAALWGVWVFREVRSTWRVVALFAASGVTLGGVVLLAFYGV